MTSSIYITFGEKTKHAELETGTTILDYARLLNIPITSRCGGHGTCGECRITVEKGFGALNERTEPEMNLKQNERLACRAKIINTLSDVKINVLHFGNLQILSTGTTKEFELSPAVERKGSTVTFMNRKIGNYGGHIFGIAADIGTTTVVLHLMNLETGEGL